MRTIRTGGIYHETHEEFTDGPVTFPSFDEDDNICVYFINDNDPDDWDEGEYFIIENRRPAFSNGNRTFSGDMMNGLLIWHHANSEFDSTSQKLDVKEANGVDEAGSGIGSCKNDHIFPGTAGTYTAFTPYTTPDTDDKSGTRTGFALTCIQESGNGITANAYLNYYTGAWSGDVTTNTAWGGNITINSDVTVESGATLYIDKGTTISFASGSTDLWIEGTIIAKGTAGNPITFTASAANPQPSEWGTIFVESDDNTFEYCTVEYSDWGIKIYDTTYLTGNEVKNCTFKDNDQGLRFQNADVIVEYNTIRDNRHGVVAINADGLFTGNSIYDNDRDGLNVIISSPMLAIEILYKNFLTF